MPICPKCKVLIPPQQMEISEKFKEKLCVFCITDKDTMSYLDEDKTLKMVDKTTIVRDYDIFLKKLSESVSIKEIINKIKKSSNLVGGK